LFPALSYAESLSKTGLERLDYRRDMITQRAGVPTCDVVCVYTSIIRSVLEYACHV